MIETVANKLELPFLAGLNAEGEPVFESLQAELLDGGIRSGTATEITAARAGIWPQVTF